LLRAAEGALGQPFLRRKIRRHKPIATVQAPLRPTSVPVDPARVRRVGGGFADALDAAEPQAKPRRASRTRLRRVAELENQVERLRILLLQQAQQNESVGQSWEGRTTSVS